MIRKPFNVQLPSLVGKIHWKLAPEDLMSWRKATELVITSLEAGETSATFLNVVQDAQPLCSFEVVQTDGKYELQAPVEDMEFNLIFRRDCMLIETIVQGLFDLVAPYDNLTDYDKMVNLIRNHVNKTL